MNKKIGNPYVKYQSRESLSFRIYLLMPLGTPTHRTPGMITHLFLFVGILYIS